MNLIPSYNCYCNYSSGNYGMHALCFTDAEGSHFWFSYKTLVAFEHHAHPRVVLQNYWRTTTGKHLNAIDGGDKKNRVDQATFDAAFAKAFGRQAKKAA